MHTHTHTRARARAHTHTLTQVNIGNAHKATPLHAAACGGSEGAAQVYISRYACGGASEVHVYMYTHTHTHTHIGASVSWRVCNG